MKRLSGWALPLILGVAGVALIIVGSFDFESDPVASLPPIVDPTATPIARSTATATPETTASAPASATPTAVPTPTPLPDDVVAEQLEVPSVGINVPVFAPTSEETCNFPPSDGAYLLCRSDADGNLISPIQPGHNRGAYVFAHAVNPLFKPLWNVVLGDEVNVRMSDGTVLRYVVTEVRPNVACPDPDADPALNPPNPPLALQIHDDCSAAAEWTAPVDYERLTLQTSQGYNRNWGELVIVAEPVGG